MRPNGDVDDLLAMRARIEQLEAVLAASQDGARFAATSDSWLPPDWNACPDGMFMLSREGQILLLSEAALTTLELEKPDVLVQTQWTDLWLGDEQHNAELALDAARAGGTGRFQGYLPTFRGNPKWWDVLISPIRDKFDRCERLLAVSRDITDLRTAEERTRLALEAARAGTIDWWMETQEYYWDARTYDIFGVPFGEHISLSLLEALIHPEDVMTARDAFQKLLPVHGRAQILSHYRIIRRDGLLRHLELSGQVYYVTRQGQLQPVRMVATVLDVTQARSSEEALRRSEAHFRTLAEAVPGFLFITGSDGTTTYINRSGEEYTGQSTEDLKGFAWVEAIFPADRESAVAAWNRSVQLHSAYEVEYRIRRHDGVYRWFLTRARPVQDGVGGDLRWLGVCVDIHAQKCAETALVESELRFRTVAEAVPSLLFSNLPGGEREYSGPRWLDFTGLTAEESQGKGWLQAIHPDDLARVEEIWAGTLQQQQPLDLTYRIRRRDGRWRWVVSRAIAFEDPQTRQNRWFGTATDIHDLRQAEQDLVRLNGALAHKVSEFETLMNVTPIGIGIAEDSECRVIRMNPALSRMFGLDLEVNTSRTPAWDHLSVRTFHDGQELKSHQLPMHLALTGQQVRAFEVDVLHGDGLLCNLFGYADPLQDGEGRITGCVGVYVDMTEVKRMRVALERSNEELQHFAYVASHDLQSPLRTVRTFAQMLQRRLQGNLDQQSDELLSHIIGGADRMMHLVRDLLTFAQAGHDDQSPVVVDTDTVLQQAVDSLRLAILEADAVIRHDSLPAVLAQPAHLAQLFQNLLSNSIKYRQPEVPPSILVSAVPKGSFCLFSISDNGQGFDPHHSQLIFEPFKRLHGKEISGTGIGLATCHRIVQRYGGRIWAESNGVGLGSTFRFTLPLPETGMPRNATGQTQSGDGS